MNTIELSKRQKIALDLLKKGYNVFLTGPGGTGKSTIIKIFKQWCEENNKNIALTSTTGVSALLINGTTTHNFAGIGLGEDSVDCLINKVLSNKFIVYRWNSTKVLVIDEISMMKPELLEKLNQIAQVVRNNANPFGGIQMVLTGDFAQLPPVYIDEKEKFCFESPIWSQIVEKTVHLNEIMRQQDKVFQKCLSEIRLGHVSSETIEILNSRVIGNVQVQKINGILPTRLFARKRNVEEINQKNLERLKEAGNETKIFTATTKVINKRMNEISPAFREGLCNKLNKSCPAPNRLELVVGAQVMLNFNYCIESKLVNGSRGVIVRFTEGIPVVRFITGGEIPVTPVTWILKENNTLSVEKTQIPLIVAYACTIHKVQGATLDLAIIDAGPSVFQFGQIYTALSRVRTLEGLYLLKFDKEKIRCHPKVEKFYEVI